MNTQDLMENGFKFESYSNFDVWMKNDFQLISWVITYWKNVKMWDVVIYYNQKQSQGSGSTLLAAMEAATETM